ncbi:MAG TPA: hypothetical protein VHY56_12940, partial [Candidatus Binataceae bacterium]|nr:hypothetical protein [Candidatus Binataceae bacterium]
MPKNSYAATPKCPWRVIFAVLGWAVRDAMAVRKYNSIVHELARSLSIALLPALIISLVAAIYSPLPAAAQTSVPRSSGTVASIATADVNPADNINRPAPAADYDLPAIADAASPDADTTSALPETAAGAEDQVLEVPQVINPASYDAASYDAETNGADAYVPASSAVAAVPSGPDDADGSADPADLVMGSPPTQGYGPPAQGGSQSQSAQANALDEAQSYVDQGTISGPVAVNAAPVYAPIYQAPATTQANRLPRPYAAAPGNGQLPIYSALNNHTLPMYSGL